LPDFPNGKWEAAAPTLGDGGRNRLINGNFSIWQRETDFVAPSGALPADSGFYTSDRWKWQFFGDGGTFNLVTSEVERATFAPGQTEVPDNPTFYMKWRGEFIGVTNGDEELDLAQQIENARTLAGQKATLSFWAKGDSAGTILVSTRQNLGLGGDVSDLPIFVPVVLTTSWKKFVVTFDIQDIAGKTLGASDQFLSLRFTSILGADVAALTGSITVNYTDTISLANVQFEGGSTATAFEIRQVATELALSQRYYQKAKEQPGFGPLNAAIGNVGAEVSTGAGTLGVVGFPVIMRDTPSVVITTIFGGIGGLGVSVSDNGIVVTKAGLTDHIWSWTADAEL